MTRVLVITDISRGTYVQGEMIGKPDRDNLVTVTLAGGRQVPTDYDKVIPDTKTTQTMLIAYQERMSSIQDQIKRDFTALVKRARLKGVT